jgi:ABC-type glutathione transport system ATPase component
MANASVAAGEAQVKYTGAGGPMLLQARNLTKSYRGRRSLFQARVDTHALDDVSLTMKPGEILGLIGESGCGKSTLAKVLLGLTHADSGSLVVEGRQIFGPGGATVPADRRGIQMVFQDPFGSLNPRMKVSDVVGEGLRIRGDLSRDEIRGEVLRNLRLVGLAEDAAGKYPHQFSGGQRQRICIARAIIMKPKLMIADEAVSALDVSVQMQILNLLLDLRDKLDLSLMFISHDMSVIEYLSDRVTVMYQGKVVEENETSALIENPQHPYTAHLISARPRVRPR